jgi:DNA-binding XRE family transcriptional regulator
MHWTLLKYRKQLGLTQSELAQKIGISTNSYGKKENGTVPFKENEMAIILKLFKNNSIVTSLNDLFL